MLACKGKPFDLLEGVGQKYNKNWFIKMPKFDQCSLEFKSKHAAELDKTEKE